MVFLQSLSVHVISSVPQGSVLHALLFLTGIAELPLSSESKLVMHTDDILLCRPNRQASYQHLRQDVEALGKWANNNYLSFNPSKLKPMIFSRKRHPVSAPSYFWLNESRLEIVEFCVPGHHYLIKLISFRTNPDRRTTFWKKKR